jgi:type IV pilus biogenesis protein CpaD/CtpE
MLNKPSLIIAFSIVLLLFAGCAYNTLETNWGSSYEAARTNQIANPEASENMNPVVGLDGELAAGNMEIYRQGCKGQDQSTTYNLRLGGIEGIGER